MHEMMLYGLRSLIRSKHYPMGMDVMPWIALVDRLFDKKLSEEDRMVLSERVFREISKRMLDENECHMLVVGGWSNMTEWSIDWMRFEEQPMKAKIVNDHVVLMRVKDDN